MRTLTAAMQTALAEGTIRPVTLVRLDFASGIVAVHSGLGELAWNGDTYLGVGDLGRIDPIKESTDLRPYGVSMTLSGIPGEKISLALSEHYQGRDARIYLGLLDAGHRLIADPTLIWQGRMDVMPIEMGETATITVTGEGRMADWHRPRVRRYNNEDQQARFPGDKGLEFVTAMVDKPIIWGQG